MKNKVVVRSSNLTNPSRSVVRIYKGGHLIVEELITKRNPLPYLRGLTRSKHFLNIERKLMKHGLTLSDVGLSPATKVLT
jgi:hypothetical protein